MVVAAVEGDAPFGPQRAQHRHLLFEDGRPLLEGDAEGVVLELVPPDAEPEPEASIAEQVELGRLLGQERRLTLGTDEDGGDP